MEGHHGFLFTVIQNIQLFGIWSLKEQTLKVKRYDYFDIRFFKNAG